MPTPEPPQASTLIVAQLQAAGCVFADDEAALLIEAAADPRQLAGMVERRVAGLPLEHILGWAEFCGIRILLDAGVFVPRRRSELVVRRALAAIAARTPAAQGADDRPPVIVDLCCGSGAIGKAVLVGMGAAELHAVDVDPAATACARRNLADSGTVHTGDLYRPLPAMLHRSVDVLIANAPYVPSGEIRLLPPEARDHEARVALDGGTDGLDILRRVIAQAPRWLADGASMIVETSAHQAPDLIRAMARSGLNAQVYRSAELGATVVTGVSAQ
ncbi:MAG: putative protein N(5)-glutamine methyltransferase [Actinomycetota bacterium]|nr:putative protein N(5)-glutamine methyltransferase [Actinomycetota bacterium]